MLQHLYENGIVHCDLKPHNIVQTAGLKWKLLDFDCAHTENQPYTRNGKRPSSGVSPPEVNQIFTSSVDTTVSCHHVSYSHDLWSFGVLAYRLCHGRGGHLWNVNEFDELESEQEMKRAANCGPADIDLAMRKICGNSAWRIPVSMRGFNVAAAAEAMVAKLLEPNPKKRASNFPKPEDLLVEPFFTGQNSMVETVSELKRAIDGLRRDIQHTGTVTETHISLLEADVQALLMQQKDSTRAILQAVASHSQNECPSVFVVTPYAWRDEFRWRASPNEQTEPSNRHSKWVDFACKLIGALSDPETSAQEVLQDAVYKRFLLRLLCEGCLKPQGAGYIIDKPGDLADDLLVMLRLSIRAVAAARLGIGVAKCFLPFLPEVPEAASTKLMQACQALEGSSGQEYIEEAKGREGMIGAAMRTWVNFLNERDPQHDWGSLNKVSSICMQIDDC